MRRLPIAPGPGRGGSGSGPAPSAPGSPPLGRDGVGPYPRAPLMTPLQAEMLEEGRLPDPDPLEAELVRPDLAPEAGYGEGGPSPLEGPGGARPGDPAGGRYDGEPRVLQWEIDPRDQNLPTGEAHVDAGEWEYALWWQEHPAGLVYVSIQAVRDDPAGRSGSARPHPVGRTVTVNLVYDLRRRAVVAIYGTARDFRPFVDAFREGYGLPEGPVEREPEARERYE